jgi:hypothetical protein
MGGFFTNLHVKGDDLAAVVSALRSASATPAYVVRGGGWLSVYPEATEDQDDTKLASLARTLSQRLGTAVIATLMHDGDIFAYWLYGKGQELDRYNSDPNYFEGGGEPPSGGKAASLVGLCQPGTSEAQLHALLHPDGGGDEDEEEGPLPPDAYQVAEALARHLGIPGDRALAGFRYLDEGEELEGAERVE